MRESLPNCGSRSKGNGLLGQPDFTQSLSDLLDSFQVWPDRLKARGIIR